MKRLQVSILSVILVTVACALAFTALKTASDFWLSALYTFTTVLLLAAVIAARFRRGNEMAFWFGFAVFGWGFLPHRRSSATRPGLHKLCRQMLNLTGLEFRSVGEGYHPSDDQAEM